MNKNNKKRRLQLFKKQFDQSEYSFMDNCLVLQLHKFAGVRVSSDFAYKVINFFNLPIDPYTLWYDILAGSDRFHGFTTETKEGASRILDILIDTQGKV